jgi:hypothetical protein
MLKNVLFYFFIFIRQVSFYFLQNDFNTALSWGGGGRASAALGRKNIKSGKRKAVKCQRKEEIGKKRRK